MKNGSRLVKYSGQVFTPDYLVSNILDYSGYTGEAILRKHVIDNSCGDGAFLCETVDRYCRIFLSGSSDRAALKDHLQTYIHGIEIEETAYRNCLYNLNAVVSAYGLTQIKWDVLHKNALTVTRYNEQMDFVVGNPPYVRVHNLESHYDLVKTFLFATGGMTDLYLVFYELGLRMLNQNGRLCYITPSSWLTSLAATNMRKHFFRHQNLVCLIDLGHFQAFDGVTTYTLIALIEKGIQTKTVAYYRYDSTVKDRVLVDNLPLREMYIRNKIYLANRRQLSEQRRIMLYLGKKYVSVKNGFATLADKVFIGEMPFKQFVIPVIKASTGAWQSAFFPYDKEGKPYSNKIIFQNEAVAHYLNYYKEYLLKQNTEQEHPNWYLYGRTQALKDVFKNKLVISTLIRDVASIKFNSAPVGTGVYSGLYILTDIPQADIQQIILNEDFISYVRILRNYKSGGCYTFNSKAIEVYLNFKLTEKYDKIRSMSTQKSRILECDLQFV